MGEDYGHDPGEALPFHGNTYKLMYGFLRLKENKLKTVQSLGARVSITDVVAPVKYGVLAPVPNIRFVARYAPILRWSYRIFFPSYPLRTSAFSPLILI